MRAVARLLLLVTLSVTAGFFAGRVFWTAREMPPQPPPASSAAPERLPDILLPDLAGATRSINEWRSGATIINFWATWCAPCRREMPLLEQVHKQRAGPGLAVIGIAIDREEPVRTFIGETGITYPILYGEREAMVSAEAFGPSFVGLPFTVIAAPGGLILKLHTGELHPDDLEAILAVLDQLAAGTLSAEGARKALEAA
jgi:thiol-disulfide isomerase/thioredoxin